jgi:hypothetical protein
VDARGVDELELAHVELDVGALGLQRLERGMKLGCGQQIELAADLDLSHAIAVPRDRGPEEWTLLHGQAILREPLSGSHGG